jgi:restriction system protein
MNSFPLNIPQTALHLDLVVYSPACVCGRDTPVPLFFPLPSVRIAFVISALCLLLFDRRFLAVCTLEQILYDICVSILNNDDDYREYSKDVTNGDARIETYVKPNDIRNFFEKNNFCPYCQKEIPEVFKHTSCNTIGAEFWQLFSVWECDSCGYWNFKSSFREEFDYGADAKSQNVENIKYGIIKKFDVADKQAPIDVLINELLKKKEILYEISPQKLEDIAQVVFSSYFDCEVKHVGKTGDEGIDLLFVLSDDPILVQVKRRESPEHIELVKSVREFVGAMYVANSKRPSR